MSIAIIIIIIVLFVIYYYYKDSYNMVNICKNQSCLGLRNYKDISSKCDYECNKYNKNNNLIYSFSRNADDSIDCICKNEEFKNTLFGKM